MRDSNGSNCLSVPGINRPLLMQDLTQSLKSAQTASLLKFGGGPPDFIFPLFHDDPVRYKPDSGELAKESKMARKKLIFIAIASLAWLGWPQAGLQGEPPVKYGADAESSSPAEQFESSSTGLPNQIALGISVPAQPGPMVPAGPSLAAASDMIAFSNAIAGGTQAITLINASRRWMAVYHIDQAGHIRLVSSRPLDADFSFQFNATAPLPEEIRRLQKR
jgi:hypothetical protein